MPTTQTLERIDHTHLPIGVYVLAPDGRFVAYYSESTNLSPADGNVFPDVYLYDDVSGTSQLVM